MNLQNCVHVKHMLCKCLGRCEIVFCGANLALQIAKHLFVIDPLHASHTLLLLISQEPALPLKDHTTFWAFSCRHAIRSFSLLGWLQFFDFLLFSLLLQFCKLRFYIKRTVVMNLKAKVYLRIERQSMATIGLTNCVRISGPSMTWGSGFWVGIWLVMVKLIGNLKMGKDLNVNRVN